MTMMFWRLLIAAVLSFALIAYLTDRFLRYCQSVYWRWACRREMKRAIADMMLSGHGFMRVTYDGESIKVRRQQLDALATAQDRQVRRIHKWRIRQHRGK